MTKTVILDFDGTFYETPCSDIPKLEDAIDLSQLFLLQDKLEQSPNKTKVLQSLDNKFAKLDKSKINANLHNQNAGVTGHKSKFLADRVNSKQITFSSLLNSLKIKRLKGKPIDKEWVFCARGLAQMMEPNGEGNHRVSGMLNLGLGITKEEISSYYRKYATIEYKTMRPNKLIIEVIENVKKQGNKLVIYTDNSKENIKKNLGSLGYKEADFLMIVDMFDCDGMTKKTPEGRGMFKNIMAQNGVDLSNSEFYDDNSKICHYMQGEGIKSFIVKPESLVPAIKKGDLTWLHSQKLQQKQK